MNIKITSNGYTEHQNLLERNIAERIPASFGTEGLCIEISINSAIGAAESYQICGNGNEWKVVGADVEGLYYGIGKFLHSAKWTEESFAPKATEGVVTPNSSFRAMYFAVHFNNWYDEAPTEELEKYVEELVLYGYNAIVCIIPIVSINSYEDEFFVRAVEKTRSMFKLAKKLSMKVGIIINPNQGMMNAPHEWDADPSYEQTDKIVRGQLGRNLCPSIPEAFEYLRSIWIKELEQYTDIGLDYVLTWPYDEGGCGCDKCRPWGAKGYANLAIAVNADAKKYYPNSKFVLSTWLYDDPNDEGEFAGLYERLKGDLSFVDYVMVDSHDQFPKYPLEHEPVKPIVNFPEISMWKLSPWGGRGANPMPKRFQAIWDSAKHVLKGGMPYSEGMYEDILKAQVVGYYWNAELTYKEILGEYINYEYSDEVINEVIEAMELMEENHINVAQLKNPDMNAVYREEQLMDAANEKLPERVKKAWRWRILYIRAKIDRILYEYFMKEGYKDENCYDKLRRTGRRSGKGWLDNDAEAQAYMQELCKYYSCISLREDKRNSPTLPPVKDGIVL